jgi:hypothetical protein
VGQLVEQGETLIELVSAGTHRDHAVMATCHARRRYGRPPPPLEPGRAHARIGADGRH